MEGMDCKLSNVADRGEAMSCHLVGVTAEIEEGRCCCGTLVGEAGSSTTPESIPSPMGSFRLIVGSGDVLNDSVKSERALSWEEMRDWAVRQSGDADGDAEVTDWIVRYPMQAPPSLTWSEADIEASLAAFPELL
jgi:hypothetical protein